MKNYHEQVNIGSKIANIIEEEVIYNIEKHGQFNSNHEAYAFILEKYENIISSTTYIKNNIE